MDPYPHALIHKLLGILLEIPHQIRLNILDFSVHCDCSKMRLPISFMQEKLRKSIYAVSMILKEIIVSLSAILI